MMRIVTRGKLRDEATNGIEDWIQCIAVAGQNHPGGEGAGPFLAKGVEAPVDDHACIGFTRASPLDREGDARIDVVGNRLRELALQSGGGAEMVQQVCVCSADFGGDGFQRDRLRSLLEQQFARGGKRDGAAFFRAEAGSSY